MGGERISSRRLSNVTVEAVDDYDSDDVEAGEVIATIELSEAEVCGDAESVVSDGKDDVASLEAAAVAVPVGSVLSMGGDMMPQQDDRDGRERAEFVSATWIKPSKNAKLGVSFRDLESERGLVISRIKKGGLVSSSGAPLRVGDRVVSVNNFSCDKLDHKRAAKVLRDSPSCVTIVAQNVGGDPLLVETMITKPSPGHTAGIGFSSAESPSRVSVCTICHDGLFADSLLSVGDEIISINNIRCAQLDSFATADIVKSAPQYVNVLAKKFEGNGVVVGGDEMTTRAMKLRKWAGRQRGPGIGPGCQLAFGVVFIAALIILLFYMAMN